MLRTCKQQHLYSSAAVRSYHNYAHIVSNHIRRSFTGTIIKSKCQAVCFAYSWCKGTFEWVCLFLLLLMFILHDDEIFFSFFVGYKITRPPNLARRRERNLVRRERNLARVLGARVVRMGRVHLPPLRDSGSMLQSQSSNNFQPSLLPSEMKETRNRPFVCLMDLRVGV